MNVGTALKYGTDKLQSAEVNSARLDSLILIEDLSGHDRGWLLANPDFQLTYPQMRKLERQLARRAKHEPIAYIRGFSEFYGRA
jgi:release factor glutamine methyltransferase